MESKGILSKSSEDGISVVTCISWSSLPISLTYCNLPLGFQILIQFLFTFLILKYPHHFLKNILDVLVELPCLLSLDLLAPGQRGRDLQGRDLARQIFLGPVVVSPQCDDSLDHHKQQNLHVFSLKGIRCSANIDNSLTEVFNMNLQE